MFFITSVGDNISRIADTLRIALGRSDLIITCGGLGPTVDDMTREAVAAATDRELVFVPALEEQIKARFSSFRMTMPENNKRQAFIPQDATIIHNPVGTAPSFITEHQGRLIVTLPGVPRELKYLFNEQVVPFLQQRYSLGIIKTRNLKVAGIGESALDEMIGEQLLNSSNPSIGLAAHHGIIDVRLTAKGDNASQVNSMLDEMEERVRQKIGTYIYGYDKDRIEDVLAQGLLRQHARLHILEVGLNGLISSLEQSKHASAFLGTVESFPTLLSYLNAYPNQTNLSYRELAATASGRLVQSEKDFAIVIISDTEVNERPDSAESTVVVAASFYDTVTRSYGFGARSELASGWVSRWAMANIWQMCMKVGNASQG